MLHTRNKPEAFAYDLLCSWMNPLWLLIFFYYLHVLGGICKESCRELRANTRTGTDSLLRIWHKMYIKMHKTPTLTHQITNKYTQTPHIQAIRWMARWQMWCRVDGGGCLFTDRHISEKRKEELKRKNETVTSLKWSLFTNQKGKSASFLQPSEGYTTFQSRLNIKM